MLTSLRRVSRTFRNGIQTCISHIAFLEFFQVRDFRNRTPILDHDSADSAQKTSTKLTRIFGYGEL